MDMTFCVLLIERNRRLSPYHQNQVLGVISTSQLSSKVQQYCAFKSHNKNRNTKTCIAGWFSDVLLLSTGPSPLPLQKLFFLFSFSWLVANLKAPRLNNWGPSTLGQSLTLPSLLSSAKQKHLDQQGCGPPCLRSSHTYVYFSVSFLLWCSPKFRSFCLHKR